MDEITGGPGDHDGGGTLLCPIRNAAYLGVRGMAIVVKTPAWYGDEFVVMFMVDVIVPPLRGVTDAGLKLHVELSGSPEQERLTAELKPLNPLTVTVNGAG